MLSRTDRIRATWVSGSLIAALAAQSCVSEPVHSGPGSRIIRAHSGTKVESLDDHSKAAVLAMAMGVTPSMVVATDPTLDDHPEDPYGLFRADQRADVDLPSTSLGDALRMLAESAAVNLVLLEPLDEAVELALQDVTMREAVRTLVRRYGLHAERDGNVLVIGKPAADQQVGRVIPLRSVSAAVVQDAVTGMISEGGSVSVSPSGNALYVRDTTARLAEIEEFLAAMDTAEKQVAIEVRIYEVGYEDNFGLGFNLSALNIDFNDAVGNVVQDLLLPSGAINANVINDSGNLSAVMNALGSLATIDLLSMPRLTTVSGREATIEIITRIPYIAVTESVDTDAGGSSTVETVEFEEVGITMKVTPTVQNDDQIRLVVEPEISDAVEFFNGVPVVDSRRVTTEVIVADRGTLFLGGLAQNNVFDGVDKVPVLGDIPYLGHLFRRTTRREVKTELILQITPRLVRAGEMDSEYLDARHAEREELSGDAEERRGFWR